MRLSKRLRALGWVGLGLIVGGVAGVTLERWHHAVANEPVATAGLFEGVMNAIRGSYVDSLSDSELYSRAARGVIGTLGDPYSSFLAPEVYRRYRESLNGRSITLGFTLAEGLTGVRVGVVYRGSAADRSGVRPGDYLVDVNGTSLRGSTMSESWAALRKASGDTLVVRFRTPGDSLSIDRHLIPEPTGLAAVPVHIALGDGVGYVALRAMSQHAARELKHAIADLRDEGVNRVIVDLRDNPGGRFEEGLAVAELFLPRGTPVGSVAKRSSPIVPYRTLNAPEFPDLGLVLLVNQGTASAAEIAAAALRDNGRTWLVGERTYGKGLIQTTISLGDSMGVRLTTGRWQRLSGATLVGGILPDSLASGKVVTLAAHALSPIREQLMYALEALASELTAHGVNAPESVWVADRELKRLIALMHSTKGPSDLELLRRHQGAIEQELQRQVGLRSKISEVRLRWSLRTDPVIVVGLETLGGQFVSPLPTRQ
ncbi:MAG: S41 family peptidase [Gemmatimonadota bacterium]